MTTDKHHPVTLTREQLYERLWIGSAQELARELGLSNVDLARVCRRHNIPYPPLGHLAKKVLTAPTSRPPLPPSDDPNPHTITFFRGRCVEKAVSAHSPLPVPKPRSTPRPESAYDEDILEILRRARALPKVQVAERLTAPHPLVQATKETFGKPWWERQALIRSHPRRLCSLSINVNREYLRRSLLFLDALIKAVERVGGKVSTEWGYKAEKTSVSFAGEVVATIRLREKHTQTRPGGDLIPTGRIMLDSGSSTYGPVYCIDTEEGKRIEDAINDLIIRWVKEAGKARIARREEEEECQREAEEERIRREREAERRAEQSRVDRLIADADAWQKSQTLRAYIQAVEERAIREHGRIEEGSEPDCWLKWAHRQADRLDPLTPSPPSIIDETP